MRRNLSNAAFWRLQKHNIFPVFASRTHRSQQNLNRKATKLVRVGSTQAHEMGRYQSANVTVADSHKMEEGSTPR